MTVDIFSTDNRYDLIMADPPWNLKKTVRKIRPNQKEELDYPTLSMDEIRSHMETACNLSGGDSVLFLWTIDKYLVEAQGMAESVGYKLHARMVWDKGNGIPAACTVRFSHEYLLYMYRGRLIPVSKEERGKIRDVFFEKPRKHSQKPEIAYDIIERLYPNLRKLELYARSEREGWDCWGNEV